MMECLHSSSHSEPSEGSFWGDEASSPSIHEEEESGDEHDPKKRKLSKPPFAKLGKATRWATAKYIILDELPFRQVAKVGFMDFFRSLKPGFMLPTKHMVKRDCMAIYLEEKMKLQTSLEELGHRVCFTTNTCTSTRKVNYLCVTAHFIDTDWVLHKKILGFRRINDHNGTSISKVLRRCMYGWGLKKVLTITVNNAFNNDTALETLKRQQLHLFGDKLAGIIRNHENLHMSCYGHILNLFAQDALSEIDDTVGRVRNLLMFVKSSPEISAKFKRWSMIWKKPYFLPLDDPTRWDSIYNMLVSVENYQFVFEDMVKDDQNLVEYLLDDATKGLGIPTSDDWIRIKHFIPFLKLFYDVALKFSASNNCTAHIFFPELYKIKRQLHMYASSEDIGFKNMAKRMQEKYDKHWGELTTVDLKNKVNKFLFVATALDPKYKLTWFRYWFSKTMSKEKGDEALAIVKGSLKEIFEEYNELYGASSAGPVDVVSSEGGTDDLTFDLEYKAFLEAENLLDGKTELDRYLMYSLEPIVSDVNILEWWEENELDFPILARVARDVLAIPLTTMSPRFVFSTVGWVLNSFQSSLAPKVVERLICARNWLGGTYETNDDYEIEDPYTSYDLFKDIDVDGEPQEIA